VILHNEIISYRLEMDIIGDILLIVTMPVALTYSAVFPTRDGVIS